MNRTEINLKKTTYINSDGIKVTEYPYIQPKKNKKVFTGQNSRKSSINEFNKRI